MACKHVRPDSELRMSTYADVPWETPPELVTCWMISGSGSSVPEKGSAGPAEHTVCTTLTPQDICPSSAIRPPGWHSPPGARASSASQAHRPKWARSTAVAEQWFPGWMFGHLWVRVFRYMLSVCRPSVSKSWSSAENTGHVGVGASVQFDGGTLIACLKSNLHRARLTRYCDSPVEGTI